MSETSTRAAFLIAAAVLAGCGGNNESVAPPPDFSRAITVERLRTAASEPQNWLTHGGTYLEQRHSALTEINRQTLSRLAPAWFYEFDTYRGQEATPLVADGVGRPPVVGFDEHACPYRSALDCRDAHRVRQFDELVDVRR